MAESYSGKDVILERIRAYWMEYPVTWNQSCRLIAEKLFIENLSTSSTHARNLACQYTGHLTYAEIQSQLNLKEKQHG